MGTDRSLAARPLAARLRTRIQWQRPPAADDADLQAADGSVTAPWTTVGSDWAEILPTSGGEIVIGGQAIATQRFNVTVRRRSDVDATWRAKVMSGRMQGQHLYVETLGQVDGGSELTLICRHGSRQ